MLVYAVLGPIFIYCKLTSVMEAAEDITENGDKANDLEKAEDKTENKDKANDLDKWTWVLKKYSKQVRCINKQLRSVFPRGVRSLLSRSGAGCLSLQAYWFEVVVITDKIARVTISGEHTARTIPYTLLHATCGACALKFCDGTCLNIMCDSNVGQRR